MASQNIRPNFYEGQYLGAADLTTAIDYGRIEDARHLLGGHTWGIAAGLQLTEKDSPAGGGQVDVYIQPGYAWDGFGRPIILLNPVKIPAELFKSITYNVALDGGVPPGRLFKIWLRYDESAAQQPGAGFEMCGAGDRNSRIGQTFGIEIGEYPDHSSHGPISVGGYTIDASEARQKFDPQTEPGVLYDESVPHQNFPTDNPRARWLILLGAVRWSPSAIANQPGKFAKRIETDVVFSNSLRRYVGVVAGAVEAANGNVRLHDRTKPYSTVASPDLVWVEGDLRIEGDANLFNGKLSFLDDQGSDAGVPLNFRRFAGGADTSLQAVIGKSNQGHNSFAIGPLNGDLLVPAMTVRDNGKVGIGTDAPDQFLTIGQDTATAAYLNVKAGGVQVLFGADANGGIVSTMSNHDLHLRAGVNVDRMIVKADGKVGIGTNTPSSSLTVAGDVGLEKLAPGTQRILPAQATMCWNDGTWLRLNQNLDYAKPIFGVHTPGVFAPGSLNVGGLGGWGDPGDGNMWVKGRVGIGTTTPQASLQVVNGAIMPALGNSSGAGISFPRDPGGGGGDEAFIRYFVTGGETTKLLIGCANDADDTIGFFQAGGERLTISGGRVGINNSNPVQSLHVHGGVAVGDMPIVIPPLVPAQPPFVLFVDGSILASGPLVPGIFPSDERLKRDIAPLPEALDTLLRLRGVQFYWRDPENVGVPPGRQMGLIAQEVEKVLPEWVREGAKGYKGIEFKGFEALVIEALRDLKTELDSLKSRSPKAKRASSKEK